MITLNFHFILLYKYAFSSPIIFISQQYCQGTIHTRSQGMEIQLPIQRLSVIRIPAKYPEIIHMGNCIYHVHFQYHQKHHRILGVHNLPTKMVNMRYFPWTLLHLKFLCIQISRKCYEDDSTISTVWNVFWNCKEWRVFGNSSGCCFVSFSGIVLIVLWIPKSIGSKLLLCSFLWRV